MTSLQGLGSGVIAPALAGALYVVTGLLGILAIDLLSFLVAVVRDRTPSIGQQFRQLSDGSSLLSKDAQPDQRTETMDPALES
ncbi:hypothetical protein GS597_17165 [Synechococcales cyanobacterium C]|uniref:Uncharacterized protein n=1 Tax=Petrachloros mirabilis ULC683 TaxID=2781853 RepID=A0A8K1ZZK1_9CYAN|nr:hypothetical protein [Petrachloros mirabilis]NCJ08205.1 hypothetical protein [Petrachloros mirabilis ULC683]